MKKLEFLVVLIVVALVALFFYPSEDKEIVESAPVEATATPPKAVIPAGAEVPWPLLKNLGKSVPREILIDELPVGASGTDEVSQLEMPEATTEVLLAGRSLFEANCAMCHGNSMQGDGSAGKSLDPRPSNLLVKEKYKYGHLQYSVYRTAAYGIEGTGMAPWGDILSPEELWAVSHFVVSMQNDPYGLATPAAGLIIND